MKNTGQYLILAFTVFMNIYCNNNYCLDKSSIGQLTIHQDSPTLDAIGYDNCTMIKNGELDVIHSLINPNDIVFDVGANKGEWSTHVLHIVPSVQIYAFEPIPAIFNQMKTTLERYNVKAFNTALSSITGKKTFFYYNQSSTLSEVSGFYHRPIIDQNFNVTPIKIDVQAYTLDTFCQEHDIHHIDFLKIDTEGSEKDVILGAFTMLKEHRISLLQFEYGGTYPDANITLEEIYTILSSHGYTIFRIIPNGLVQITKWHPELETYRYCNYIAMK